MNKKELEGLLVIIGIVLVPVEVLWNGYVLMVVWGWFIATTFSLVPLSLPAACGIKVVMSCMVRRYSAPQAEEAPMNKQFIKLLTMVFFMPLISLGIGWVINQWM